MAQKEHNHENITVEVSKEDRNKAVEAEIARMKIRVNVFAAKLDMWTRFVGWLISVLQTLTRKFQIYYDKRLTAKCPISLRKYRQALGAAAWLRITKRELPEGILNELEVRAAEVKKDGISCNIEKDLAAAKQELILTVGKENTEGLEEVEKITPKGEN